MSNYNKIIPTLAGSNLLVEAIKSKRPLIFTRIALGDGTLTESESIESLTALKHPMAQNTVQAINSRGNGEIDVVATISNASVTSGFYARELGVFAKVGDTGTEKLFAYTNAGAQASYTPAGTSLDEKLITVTFYIGNDANVKINLNSQLYITQAALDTHNLATNAHDNRFNAIIQQVNNMITSVDNSASLAKAPTLQLVKTLLSSLNIKNATDVVNALESEKATSLGIRYDFSNVNAWYICLGKLFGNLIIQGGNNLVKGNRAATITLPISYSNFFIPVSNPEYDSAHKFVINMVSMYSGKDGLNKVHLNTDVWGDSDVDKEIYCWWLTVGI